MSNRKIEKFKKISEIAEFNDGYVISKEYVNNYTNMIFKCKNGHIWETAPRNLLYANCWCPTCYRKLAGERLSGISIEKSKSLLNLEVKFCKYCKLDKNINQFPKKKYVRDNRDFYTHGNKCTACERLYINEYRQDYYVSSLENFFVKKLEFARKNSKKLGVNYSIDLDCLLELWGSQDGKCAISGIGMTYERNNITDASIDRIDSNKGYESDNIQLLCVSVNFMKRKSSTNDFVYMCKIISKHNE